MNMVANVRHFINRCSLLTGAKKHLVSGVILFVAAFAVYGRILGHNFIFSWDDYYYVINNLDIQESDWEHIRAVFSSYYIGNYAPVQMLSYMLDFAIWGMNPAGFLLTNLLLHLSSGLMVYRLFLQLHKSCYPALAGSMIFLLHPVQVESVAWISQRKSLLAMVLFLASWECYRRYREKTGNRGFIYLSSLTLFLLAGLSKSVVVILPLVLILYDYYFPAAVRHKRWLDQIPFIAISILLSLVTVSSQQPDTATWGSGSAGGMSGYHGGSPWATFLTMVPVMCRYLQLLVWPADLSILYDNPIYKSISPPVVLAAALLLLLMALACRLLKGNKPAIFWALFYVVALLPVAQIIPIVTLMNDRYLYFPMIGVAGLAALLAAKAEQRYGAKSRAAVLLLVVISGLLSFYRAGVWREDITLWQDAAVKTPGRAEVWQNLGLSLQASTNRKKEAIVAFEKSLAINPRDTTLFSLAKANKELGDYRTALSQLELLVALSPDNVMGLTALGDTYRLVGEYDLALSCLLKAQTLQPEAVQIIMALGKVHAAKGALSQARNNFLVVEKEWQDAESPFQLACVEGRAGNTELAFSWLDKALQRGYNDEKELNSRSELLGLKVDPRFAPLLSRYFPGKEPK